MYAEAQLLKKTSLLNNLDIVRFLPCFSIVWFRGTCVIYLPFVHLLLLLLVLLDQLFQYLLETLRIGFEDRLDILNGPLNKNAIDHSKTFTVLRQWSQRFKDKPRQRRISKNPMNGRLELDSS